MKKTIVFGGIVAAGVLAAALVLAHANEESSPFAQCMKQEADLGQDHDAARNACVYRMSPASTPAPGQ